MREILNQHPTLRSAEQIQMAKYGLQHVQSFSEYPLHMQEKLATVAYFQEYVTLLSCTSTCSYGMLLTIAIISIIIITIIIIFSIVSIINYNYYSYHCHVLLSVVIYCHWYYCYCHFYYYHAEAHTIVVMELENVVQIEG